nr:unnamed protein product [Digitaria exilis]
MAPTAGRSKPSGSMSAIVADATSGYHILKIDGYSHTKGTKTGAFIKSHPFTVGGHRWFIQYYPNGNTSESADYVSLFVYLDEVVNKPLNAQHQFCLIDDLVEETPLLSSVSCSFESYRGWVSAKFILREDLEKSKYLKNDSFMVRWSSPRSYAQRKWPRSLPSPSSLYPHQTCINILSEKGTDVVFEVGCETFKAHRCVLAARSPVFSAELFGQMQESDATGVVNIGDMEAHVFKALLFFIYTDSLLLQTGITWRGLS